MKYDRRLQKHWEGKSVPFPLDQHDRLLLLFRSLLPQLKAILINVLSVSAAYGVLVFSFQ
jgi:uncharacterized membrane protein YdfJ with MMPL/SSD domain